MCAVERQREREMERERKERGREGEGERETKRLLEAKMKHETGICFGELNKLGASSPGRLRAKRRSGEPRLINKHGETLIAVHAQH